MAPILGHGLRSSPSTLDDNWVVMLFTMFISMLDTTHISVDNFECFICRQIIPALRRVMVKPINQKINSWEVVKNGVLVDLMHEHLHAQGSHA
jgi:phosphatidylserine decarboxylase